MEPNDQERFVAHFVRHESAIHSFVLTIVPPSIDADEIVQDASLKMWQRFDQFTEGTNFKNWAFQVAKYTAMNHIRKIKHDRHVFASKLVELLAQDVEKRSSEFGARRAALQHCLKKLKAADRYVLSNCYSEKTSIKEFALGEQRTTNAVYKQLDRIRRNLFSCISNTLGTSGAT